ncbi:hypothetical protein [Streptomyces sp. NPDC058252]|uniref:hypothetical protein n=1 Tax=Streptomyces sp. NPDC058252 TaxID=3346405 RepID=UPI0036ED409A
MVEEQFELDRGTVVFDTVKEIVAEVMEVGHTRVSLRRPNGGVEWERDPKYLRPPTASEMLRPRVAEANARSRGER